MLARSEDRPLSSLGLPFGGDAAKQTWWGTLVGVVLMGAVLVSFAVFGWLRWQSAPEAGSPFATAAELLGLLALAAFAEELLFRGYPFQVVLRRFGPFVAILSTSAAFGALHAFNPGIGPLALVNITLAGVLLGVAYLRTGSLWFATGVHLGWNWVMAVSELSVSGIDIRMPDIEPTLTGPAIMTGGGFGPEGGLIVTVMSLIGIVWMWRMDGQRENLFGPQATTKTTEPSNESQ